MDTDVQMHDAADFSAETEGTANTILKTRGRAAPKKSAGGRERHDQVDSGPRSLRRLVRDRHVAHSRFRTITSSAVSMQSRHCSDQYGEAVWQEMRQSHNVEGPTIEHGAPLYEAEAYWTEMQTEASVQTAENEYHYESSSDEEEDAVYEQLAQSSARAHEAPQEAAQEEERCRSVRYPAGAPYGQRRPFRDYLDPAVQQRLTNFNDYFLRHVQPFFLSAEIYPRARNTWSGTVEDIISRLERKEIHDLSAEEWELMKEQYGEGICSICYDPLDLPCLTPCFHVFCAECLVRWAKEHSSCPLCRDKFMEGDVWVLVDGKEAKITKATRWG